MPDDPSVAIERLRTSTQRLNAICDEAGKTIRSTETFLQQLHLGVTAWVKFNDIPEDDEGRHCTSVYIGYARHASGKFRVLVMHSPPWATDPSEETIRPWSECSRDEKLESFEKLPELLIELAKRVDQRTAKAEQTITAVSSLLHLPAPGKGD